MVKKVKGEGEKHYKDKGRDFTKPARAMIAPTPNGIGVKTGFYEIQYFYRNKQLTIY